MKKPLIILGVILAAGAAFILAFPAYNPFKTKAATASPGTAAAGTVTANNGSFIPATPVVKGANGFPLEVGDTGDYVSQMQAGLNSRYGSELVVDGIFGEKTRKALSANGFTPPIDNNHFVEIIGA